MESKTGTSGRSLRIIRIARRLKHSQAILTLAVFHRSVVRAERRSASNIPVEFRMRRKRRLGSSSVEFALCLPFLVLVVTGTVETCSLIHLQETLKTASYEAARLAAQGPSERQAAIDRASQIVTSRGIVDVSVVFEPADLASVPVGGYITTTVRVETASQGQSALLLPRSVYGSEWLSAETTMVREKG